MRETYHLSSVIGGVDVDLALIDLTDNLNVMRCLQVGGNEQTSTRVEENREMNVLA